MNPVSGSIPFWFWNGEQDETRLDVQLDEAARAGFAGLAIHARMGNRTPYLSPRWMALVRHACLQASARGLEIWLYDEADYPSGTADRRIVREQPDLRQRTLAWTTCSAGKATALPELLACFRREAPEAPCVAGELPVTTPVLAFHVERTERYVDTLDPRTCPRFIELTHEAYADALGGLLGSVVTAVYTDDVNYHMQDRNGLGWTADLPDEFARRRGYTLLPRLPALVADLPGAPQVRIDLHRTLLELFLERWVRPQAAWCRAHGVRFLGHLRGDEGPLWMLAQQCGAAMPYHAELDIPSIDDFLMRARNGGFARRARTDYGLSPALLYRQAASVADQFGDGVVSSEVAASMGWGASPGEMHRQLLFEMLMGINLLTHHAVSVSTAGEAKRDHPPSWFSQQPWWEAGPAMLACHDRIAGWVREGSAAVEVCIIFPTTAVWACLRGLDRRAAAGWPMETRPTCDDLECILADLVLALVRAQVPFHFADELLLARSGTTVDGRLRLGAASYSHILLPAWPCLESTTIALLRQCAATGVPIHGWDHDLGTVRHRDAAAAVAALPRAWVIDQPEVVVQLRRRADGPVWIAGNCGEHAALLREPPTPGAWLIEDARDGSPMHTGAWPAAGLMMPVNACWRITQQASAIPVTSRLDVGSAIMAVDWRWEGKPATIALFDLAELPDGHPVPLHAVPDGAARPPYLDLNVMVPEGVEVLAIIGEQLALVHPSCDGQPLPAVNGTHPCSLDLQRIPCRMQPGTHRLRLHTAGILGRLEDVGLEVAGMVGLRELPGIGWLPELRPWSDPRPGDDLASQGLPFHWGGLELVGTCSCATGPTVAQLELGRIGGLAFVTVNDRPARPLWHAPWSLEVGLNPGVNRIRIRLLGTAQNLLGPHRSPDDQVWAPHDRPWTLPAPPFRLQPWGLLAGPPELRI